MAIKILFTKSFGQVIADVEENIEGGYKLTNPCVIQIAQGQLGLIPLLGTVEEKVLTLPEVQAINRITRLPSRIYN
jgi:hypothetical protein